MKEQVVKHGVSFEIHDTESGIRYLMMIYDYSFSYATVSLQEIITYKRKRFFFFGEMVERKRLVTVVSNSRDKNIDPVINRRLFYDRTQVIQILKSILRQKTNVDIVNSMTI